MRNHFDHDDISAPPTAMQIESTLYELNEQVMDNTSAHLDAAKSGSNANWFDANGFDCTPDEAEFVVFGPCADGNWHTVELGNRNDIRMQ